MAKKITVGLITTLILAVIILVILMNVIGQTASDVANAAGNMTCTNTSDAGCTQANASGNAYTSSVYPLTAFFGRGGIVLLAFMAGVVITVIVAFIKLGKSK